MRPATLLLTAGLTVLAAFSAQAQNQAQNQARTDRPHNLILFIPDGMRALKVTPDTAPAMGAKANAIRQRKTTTAINHINYAFNYIIIKTMRFID